jgi:uncharacterized protein YkwD
MFLTGFVAFSLAASSGGGAFATAALAATPDEVTQATWRSDSGANQAAIGGLVALGLLTIVVRSGHGTSGAAPDKISAPQPAPVQVSNPRPAPAPAPAPAGLTADEQRALSALNADRAANGLPPLRINMGLTRLAGDYAQDMINRNFFAHNNPEGQTPFDRMRARGIPFGYAGENLAINNSVSAAEQAFMNSPGHRANILNPHYTQVGVGVRYNGGGSVYVVQEFTDG